jgi:hypothetical protein
MITVSSLNIGLRIDGPLPIAGAPTAETVALTIDNDQHSLLAPNPSPGAMAPPSAKSSPPLLDVNVTLDSAHSTPANCEDVFVFRSEFDPSRIKVTELPSINIGAEPLTSTSRSSNVKLELRTDTANSLEEPVTVNE